MRRTELQPAIRALSSPIRRELLWKVWDRELTVTEMAEGLHVSAPTISVHLKKLKEADLVAVRAEGTKRWYRAQQEAVGVLRGLFDHGAKWSAGRDHPEQQFVTASSERTIVAQTDAPCSAVNAFRAFTDGRLYSQWLGGEVSIEAGRFRGVVPEITTEVRGSYVMTLPPSLIVMDWDFELGDVPVPGDTRRAHLIIEPDGPQSCRLMLTPFLADPSEADYFVSAWRFVLGRFRTRIEDVLGDNGS